MQTETFTDQDVTDLAELLRPAFCTIALASTSLKEAAFAAVDATRRNDTDAVARLLPKTQTIAKMLGGTYDEFRAEAK